jgi:uncharacterized protein (TIGR03066 family)
VSANPVPKEKTVAEKLVGTWKLVKSSQGTPEDVTFLVTFGEKGEMTLKIEPKDKDADPVTLKGKYKLVDGDKKGEEKIDYEMDNGTGGKKQEVLKIKKLTDDELVTTDPDDIKEEFKRVKDAKKKDDK